MPDYIFNHEFEKTSKLIVSAVERAEFVVTNLLDFSREGSSEGRSVNVEKLMQQILMLYKSEMIKKRVELIENIEVKQVKLTILTEEFKSIIMNLISNAVEAASEGGKIIINVTEDEAEYHIVIRDDAGGIPQEIKESIFNPFFSTKDKSENAGLGLWIVKREVEQGGGSIEAVNNDIGGTDMVIELPKEKIDEE